jgi:NADH-ubiquinone oxidoreductase chain 4
MLTALLLMSLAGAFALLPISEGTEAGDSRRKRIAVVTSMVNFFVSIVLWKEIDSSASQYQSVQEFNNLSFCHFHIGIDGISLYFVLRC